MNTNIKVLNMVTGKGIMRFRWSSVAVALLFFSACASVPLQIAELHQKELEIITSLKQSHIAMVDSYVDQKILVFETFFFEKYGPRYLKNWREDFKEVRGRDYDESRDFNLLYNDLVAEYQSEVAPIEKIRSDLREAILREFRHVVAAHEAVDDWINSFEKLNSAQREAFDRLLGAIKPGLSLDSVDKALSKAKEKVEAKISQLSK